MTDAPSLPTPLPPPPRSVRAGRQLATNLGCGRVFILPFVLAGLALLLAVPARLAVQAFGHPIDAIVEAVNVHHGSKGQVSHSVAFHYELAGRRWDESQEVTADESTRVRVGDRLTGRAVAAFGRSMAITSAGSASLLTAVLAFAALIVNGVVGLLVYNLYVSPRRERQLLERGTAVAGEVTARREVRTRSGRAVNVAYRFAGPAGPVVGAQRVVGRDCASITIGRAVTVVYDPDRPTRNVVYEFSGHALG